MPISRSVHQAVTFLIGLISFFAAYFWYSPMMAADTTELLMVLVSVLAFWIGTELQEPDYSRPLLTALQQICLTAGLNLILQALLSYILLIEHVSRSIIVAGTLIACLLTLPLRIWIRARLESSGSGILVLGMDVTTHQLVTTLAEPVLGFLGGNGAAIPRDMAFLGNMDRFDQVVSAKRPSRIIVSDRNWAAAISPATLLNCRLTGIAVDDVCTLYEKVFDRICCARISPAELVLAPELVASPRTMAIQSVYTDLAGLFFLVLLSPLLMLVSVGILLLGGPGPILQRVECLGFQRIPFYLLRFRCRRHDASRQLTRFGRLIMRLGLMNLPHLINVIRGEMSLFGPNPVRREFAARLIELMPFYSHRFSVKPGVLSWAEVRLETDVISNEALRIEYDLFYIKENSPTLDLEILIRFILGRWKHPVMQRTGAPE